MTSSVHGVHQGSSHALGPHEPYINDATPILPITAIDSIPWISDYQPIAPIQDDEEGGGGQDYYNDYDDRRNKIANRIAVHRKGNAREDDVDKAKSFSRSIRKYFVLSKGGKKAIKRQKLLDITRRKLAKFRRNVASNSEMATVRISPVKLQKFFSNKLKRLLLHRLKLFDLSAVERRGNKKSLT